MKSIVLLLVLVTTGLDAQSYLQIRRGNAADRPTLRVGEPAFDRDSLDMWMGSDSGNVLIGGRSVVYGKATFAKDAGSTDTYAITLVPTLPNYYNGLTVRFMANTANTGTATLNVNSVGAKTIYKGGLVSDTLKTGDIPQYGRVTVTYADSAWFIQSQLPTTVVGDPSYLVLPAIENGDGAATTLAYSTSDSGWVHGRRIFIPKSITPDSVKITWSGSVGGSGTRDMWVGLYNYNGTTLIGSVKISLAGTLNYNVGAWTAAIPSGNYILTHSFIATGTAAITMRVHQISSMGAVLNTQTTKNYFVSDQRASASAMPATLGTMTDPSNNQSKSLPWTVFFKN